MATAFVVFMIVMVMLMLFVVVSTAAMALFMVMVVVMFLGFLPQLIQLSGQAGVGFHSLQELYTCQLIPIGGDQGSGAVQAPHQLYSQLQLFFCQTSSMAQDDGSCVFYLILVKFSEVFQIYLGLLGIHYGGEGVEHQLLVLQILDGLNHIAELAYTRGFDENPLGMVFLDNLV